MIRAATAYLSIAVWVGIVAYMIWALLSANVNQPAFDAMDMFAVLVPIASVHLWNKRINAGSWRAISN